MNLNWYKISKKTDHKYSWVYIKLPEEICELMKNFSEQIDPEDLFVDEGDGGLETDFHSTIKYGLLTEDIKEIKECLEGLKGGKVYMGSSSIFETEKYDVVKIEVESKALENLHNSLNRLPHEDKYMEYKAHATIAYVKSGKGKKYDNKFKLNETFSFGEVFFGNNKKDFTIKLSFVNGWYKESMSLDPQAYQYEKNPARLREHQDAQQVFLPSGKITTIPQDQDASVIQELYSGVHFAFTPEHAALYACGKATKEDPPVIIEIDPKGLKQQKDVDAMVDKYLICYISEKKKDWQKILQSGKSIEDMAYDILEDLEKDMDYWHDEGDVNDTADDVIIQQQVPIPPSVIKSLITKNPKESLRSPNQVVNTIKQLISGRISEKAIIKMVGQMRVNNSIDSSRVKAIYQIPWLDLSAEITNDPYGMEEEQLQEYLEDNGWHMEEDDIVNEKGQIVPSYESLLYSHWLSQTPLYVNKQLSFKGYSSKDSVWHGTTLSRAKSAYPDLLSNTYVQAKSKKKSKKSKKYKSWYKAPFMRAMNYIGASKNVLAEKPPIYYVGDVTAYGSHFVIFKIRENYWAYQLSFPDWISKVKSIAIRSPGKALGFAKKNKSHAYQVTKNFPMPYSVIREEGQEENNEYIVPD